MSIERTSSFKTSDGKVFDKLDAAKGHEFAILILEELQENITDPEHALECAEAIGEHLVDSADVVVDILSTTERSIAKARAINGGKKPRKVKESTEETQMEMGMTNRSNGLPVQV